MSELFDIPETPIDRLSAARSTLAKAEDDLARAEEADENFDGFGVDKRWRDAVAAARYELSQAELERINRK